LAHATPSAASATPTEKNRPQLPIASDPTG
jgi:hypothetical protein